MRTNDDTEIAGNSIDNEVQNYLRKHPAKSSEPYYLAYRKAFSAVVAIAEGRVVESDEDDLTPHEQDLQILDYMAKNPAALGAYARAYALQMAGGPEKGRKPFKDRDLVEKLGGVSPLQNFLALARTKMNPDTTFMDACLATAAEVGSDFIREMSGEFLHSRATQNRQPIDVAARADGYRKSLVEAVAEFPNVNDGYMNGVVSEDFFKEIFPEQRWTD